VKSSVHLNDSPLFNDDELLVNINFIRNDLEHSQQSSTAERSGPVLSSVSYSPEAMENHANGFNVCSKDFIHKSVENWHIDSPVASGVFESINFSYGLDYLAGSASFKFEHVDDFKRKITDCYRSLFQCIDQNRFPHLARIWHYIPDIHKHEYGLERYKHFCEARHTAFVTQYNKFTEMLPAASAVGVAGDTFYINFIATRAELELCENSRQCSAYHYPTEFGPQSPSFARATLIRNPESVLLISGTASIVGYESCHIDDVTAQTNETVRNISQLINDVNHYHQAGFNGLSALKYVKVYVRHVEHQAEIIRILSQAFPKDVDMVILIADICREELLVEVEAIAIES